MGGAHSSSSWRAWLRPGLLLVGIVVLGLVQEDKSHAWDGPAWLPVLDLSIGWTMVVCGVLSMAVRPGQPAGRRLVVAGFLSFELGFFAADDPAVQLLGFAFGNYNDLALMVLALSFPTRVAAWRPGRLLLATLASLYLLQSLVRIGLLLPAVGGPAVLAESTLTQLVPVVDVVRAGGVVACGIALVWLLIRLPAAQHRGTGLVLLAGAATAVASATNAQYALTVLGFLPQLDESVNVPLAWVFNTVRIAVPLAILAGVVRTQSARTALVAAVRDVGPAPSSTELRDALAAALDDPDLRLFVAESATGRFADATTSVSAAELDDLRRTGRTVMPVVVDGEQVAALVLSGPPLDEGLTEAAASLTGLVVHNQRLAGLVQAQLLAVRASRARLVDAADQERRRIERDLHDGLQQRMVALAVDLRTAQTDLAERTEALQRGADEVLAILEDVRELARGIHPAILTEAGLGPAIQAAANRSPIPVEVSLRLQRDRSAAVNAAAYYVASEALANVAKHAGAIATAAWITADDTEGQLRIIVEDDGTGGADPSGHGLGGLADRVAALDGSFNVGPRAGGGTRVEAVIPT